jgi:hypothetical protein
MRLRRHHRREYGELEHPASEEDLAALVTRAAAENLKLRVRGAVHSGVHGIYANHAERWRNRVLEERPPAGKDFNLQLDRYDDCRPVVGRDHVVAAQAGIHLGEDPSEHGASLDRSLLHRLDKEHRWMLADVGGITHQTVGGFIATASAGGSVKYSFEDSLVGVRIINSKGVPCDIKKGDAHFDAMFGNLGLLGVVSQVEFKCEDRFYICGSETASEINDCEVDLFGERNDDSPSLEDFLSETDFARIEWWPQCGAERVVVWKAKRLDEPIAGKPIEAYRRFGPKLKLQQMLLCFVLTVLGNTTDLRRAKKKLRVIYDELHQTSVVLCSVFAVFVEWLLRVLKIIERLLRIPLSKLIPYVFPMLLQWFCPLEKPKRGKTAKRREFYDYAWHGLPMDNELSDVFVPTAFTELFVPLGEATALMQVLRTYFEGGGKRHVAYRRTGLFAFEAYAAKKSESWLSPAYSTGAPDCPWSKGAFRFNAYWFALNDGSPEHGIFKELWEHLRDEDIKFRLHWGKFQPVYDDDGDQWRAFFKSQYPRWDDFLALRKQFDPDDVFLTSYWQERFGL